MLGRAALLTVRRGRACSRAHSILSQPSAFVSQQVSVGIAVESCSSARHLAAASTAFRQASPASAAETPTPTWQKAAAAVGVAAGVLGGAAYLNMRKQDADLPAAEEGAHLVNWSGTHEICPRQLYQPETHEQLEHIVQHHHRTGEKLRAVGSALSPNGLGFADDDKHDMVSLALMDKVLEVDRVSGRARIQAGARIADVLEALRPHGLTLQNIASIREQAMGGFVQVGAHGTGAAVPPMDEQVVEVKLVTPGRGTLTLSAEDPDPELFYMARVGLGACGVISEIVLQAVPVHQLLEHTYVSTLKDVKKRHAKTLRDNRHVRYMWIPHTDAVVVVTNNPHREGRPPPRNPARYSESEKTAAFQKLLLEAAPEMKPEAVAAMTFAQLRDDLLAKGALDKRWVKRVNEAEADFWRRNSGYRVGWSDELLAFDCGGQQWVLETAFPAGTLSKPSFRDLQYMEDLLANIESAGIGAPAPIEQRWCGRSRSAMSPAAGLEPDSLTSWVGIIMYLPEDDPKARAAVTSKFREYAEMAESRVAAKHGAVPHWAKLEVPEHPGDLRDLKMRLAARYPVARFAAARRQLDPKNILGNRIVDSVLPRDA